jgi:uncharacterized Zn-finger protein
MRRSALPYNARMNSPSIPAKPIPKPAQQANAAQHYEVTRADLPLSCPMPQMALWNSHPRVYLPIEATGWAKCAYCGAEFTLKE